MTLTFEIDLDILPSDLYAKIQVCTSVRSAVRARQTDIHSDVGCKDEFLSDKEAFLLTRSRQSSCRRQLDKPTNDGSTTIKDCL